MNAPYLYEMMPERPVFLYTGSLWEVQYGVIKEMGQLLTNVKVWKNMKNSSIGHIVVINW
jgi:hypothetical protein